VAAATLKAQLAVVHAERAFAEARAEAAEVEAISEAKVATDVAETIMESACEAAVVAKAEAKAAAKAALAAEREACDSHAKAAGARVEAEAKVAEMKLVEVRDPTFWDQHALITFACNLVQPSEIKSHT
jgi:hypothetical protein